MSSYPMITSGRSRADIRSLARTIRERLNLLHVVQFPIMHVLELTLHVLAPGYELEIVEDDAIGDNHGLTDPIKKVIYLRHSVYQGALNGNGRDRATVAHELGHAIMHTLPLLGRVFGGTVATYCDPEWQAKAFAAELLFSHDHRTRFSNPVEAAKEVGISIESARYQWKVYGMK